MTLYELLLFVHVSAVIVWIGGGVMFTVLAARNASTAGPPNPDAVVRTAEQAEWLGKFYYTPAAIVTLVAGVWLVVESGIGFDHLWIVIGLGAVIISGILGGAFFGRKSKALIEAVRARGFDEEAQGILKQIVLVSNLELVMLFIAVFAMTVKPEL